MTRILLLAGLALGATAVPAVGQSLGYEGFNYTSGGTLNALNGGTGWGNAWSVTTPSSFSVAPGSLSNPGGTLGTSGNQVQTDGTGTAFYDANRTLTADLRSAAGSSAWVSFTARRVAPFATPDYGGLAIGNEGGDAGSNTGRLFIGKPGSFDNWCLERAGGGAISVSNFTVADFPSVLLVANIQFQDNGPETIRLYVNPTPGGGVPAGVSAALTTLDLNPSNGPVTNVSLFFSGSAYQYDEIRFGETFEQVTPVPEPIAVITAVAATLGVLRGLRRRARFLS